LLLLRYSAHKIKQALRKQWPPQTEMHMATLRKMVAP
jgi:hypothetical protein